MGGAGPVAGAGRVNGVTVSLIVVGFDVPLELTLGLLWTDLLFDLQELQRALHHAAAIQEIMAHVPAILSLAPLASVAHRDMDERFEILDQ